MKIMSLPDATAFNKLRSQLLSEDLAGFVHSLRECSARAIEHEKRLLGISASLRSNTSLIGGEHGGPLNRRRNTASSVDAHPSTFLSHHGHHSVSFEQDFGAGSQGGSALGSPVIRRDGFRDAGSLSGLGSASLVGRQTLIMSSEEPGPVASVLAEDDPLIHVAVRAGAIREDAVRLLLDYGFNVGSRSPSTGVRFFFVCVSLAFAYVAHFFCVQK